jgi:hypothetical protein
MLLSKLLEDLLVSKEKVGYRPGEESLANVRVKLPESSGEENSSWISFCNPIGNPGSNHLLVFGLSYSSQSAD